MQAIRWTTKVRLRLIDGSERLSRSDCKIGVPAGVMKATIDRSKKVAASSTSKLALERLSHWT